MAECNLCGYPVGSDACNAQHGLREVRVAPKRPKRNDFIRGYCCAVSVLLRENGRNTLTDSLLRQCGSPADITASADESDLMEFRKAGMLP
jgi:hypothetical protein